MSIGKNLPDALIQRLDVPGPRYTSYPTVPEWTPGCDAKAYDAHLRQAATHPELYAAVGL